MIRASALLAAVALLGSAAVRAQDSSTEPARPAPPAAATPPAPATPPPPAATPSAPAATPPPAAPKAADDFDLLAPEKPVDPAQRALELKLQGDLNLRRTMLQLHQIGGFATIATLGATVIVGQLNYSDKYGGGGDTGKYHTTHQVLAYSSAGIFAATGLLALFAPSPFDKPLRLDTATLHKVSMGVATAGMVAEVVLGIITSRKEGQLSQRDLALTHQIIGYTTLAATTTGFAILFF